MSEMQTVERVDIVEALYSASKENEHLDRVMRQWVDLLSGKTMADRNILGFYSRVLSATKTSMFGDPILKMIIKTAAATRKGIFFNEDFFERLLREDKKGAAFSFVLVHELSHIIRRHVDGKNPVVYAFPDKEAMQMACKCQVNMMAAQALVELAANLLRVKNTQALNKIGKMLVESLADDDVAPSMKSGVAVREMLYRAFNNVRNEIKEKNLQNEFLDFVNDPKITSFMKKMEIQFKTKRTLLPDSLLLKPIHEHSELEFARFFVKRKEAMRDLIENIQKNIDNDFPSKDVSMPLEDAIRKAANAVKNASHAKGDALSDENGIKDEIEEVLESVLRNAAESNQSATQRTESGTSNESQQQGAGKASRKAKGHGQQEASQETQAGNGKEASAADSQKGDQERTISSQAAKKALQDVLERIKNGEPIDPEKGKGKFDPNANSKGKQGEKNGPGVAMPGMSGDPSESQGKSGKSSSNDASSQKGASKGAAAQNGAQGAAQNGDAQASNEGDGAHQQQGGKGAYDDEIVGEDEILEKLDDIAKNPEKYFGKLTEGEKEEILEKIKAIEDMFGKNDDENEKTALDRALQKAAREHAESLKHRDQSKGIGSESDYIAAEQIRVKEKEKTNFVFLADAVREALVGVSKIRRNHYEYNEELYTNAKHIFGHPALTPRGRMELRKNSGFIALMLDTSGSVGSNNLMTAVSDVFTAMRVPGAPPYLAVAHADTNLRDLEVLDKRTIRDYLNNEDNFKVTGRGGTSMIEPLEELLENFEDMYRRYGPPYAIIYATDGELFDSDFSDENMRKIFGKIEKLKEEFRIKEIPFILASYKEPAYLSGAIHSAAAKYGFVVSHLTDSPEEEIVVRSQGVDFA